jgi:hypothetical protein
VRGRNRGTIERSNLKLVIEVRIIRPSFATPGESPVGVVKDVERLILLHGRATDEDPSKAIDSTDMATFVDALGPHREYCTLPGRVRGSSRLAGKHKLVVIHKFRTVVLE